MKAAADPDQPAQDWPLREASRFVEAGGVRWHVQVLGAGPVLLLLHGTGAATHSWRDLAPRLAQAFTVVAPDLPGHGFSGPLAGGPATPQAMAAALQALLKGLDLVARFACGHSAGAAIAAQMALGPSGHELQKLAWINPALLPLEGWPGLVFAPLARHLARSRWVPHLAAWRASDRRSMERLIAGTGSVIDDRGMDFYQRVVRNPQHVAGALAMMAGWELAPLAASLPRLRQPVLILVGDNDRTVPPRQSEQLVARLPHAELERLPGLGHLAHEEQPAQVAQRLERWLLAP